jgi:hypothetical protein
MNKTFPFEAHINGVNEKRLRYFYTVMMLGSIRQAADLLDIEQSAISRQIQLFESELKRAKTSCLTNCFNSKPRKWAR